MPAARSTFTRPHIRTEGNLLPADTLEQIAREERPGMRPQEYGLAPNTRLRNPIADTWTRLQTHWASFKLTREEIERESESGTSETREWMQRVFRTLGYDRLMHRPSAETVHGASFLISHRAGESDNAPPIHITSFRNELDRAEPGTAQRRTPHALLQGYLNHTPHLWGIVTNGLRVRLLRENRQIDRVSLLEFDLEAMLEHDGFADFELLWLILHRSRFVQPGEPQETAWLEQWTRTAQAEGTRAMEGLRGGVEEAIEALGQGLLDHRENEELRRRLASSALGTAAFYRQLLRLVYRLLFLMVAEERDLLFPRPAEDATTDERARRERARERYMKHYSVTRLRREASRRRVREGHRHDLWLQLLVTFDAMAREKEARLLGLGEPLQGGLFGAGSCPDIADDAAPGTTGSAPTDGRPRVANRALLAAIQALGQVTRERVTRQINYRDLDVEELGSVYESLLDHEPAITPGPDGTYRFSLGSSGERKATGSYYTPRGLVQELLNSALDPVIAAALAGAATPEAQRRNLLELNVCDPACGSGHFLLGAARRIGRRLAEIDAGPGNEPTPSQLRHGVSEAIRHCIYGVDKNPLAIDLCRVALWLESHEPGAPLGFLDHHIKRGDSLVGVFDLTVLERGIPDDAYTPVSGDDRKIATALKTQNRKERPKAHVDESGRTATVRALGLWQADDSDDLLRSLATRLDEIDAMPDGTAAQVQSKADAYAHLLGRDDWHDVARACHLWTYAFFAPLNAAESHLVPTSSTVRAMLGGNPVHGQLMGRAEATASEVGFFHWPLEFPEIFVKGRGGFDTVLGNPPWERVKLQEKEFFAAKDPEIATAPNKAARDQLIRTLSQRKPDLAAAFGRAQREAEGASLFMRKSERFPLAGRGDVNLYSVFAEHARNLAGPRGRAGIIVPTGIVTDDTNKLFFQSIVDSNSLVSFFAFENEEYLFPGVHHDYRFATITLTGSESVAEILLVFFARQISHIHDTSRQVWLTSEDFALFNPNTRTCPIFRTERDAELTKLIYRAAPVLVNEAQGEVGNPWGVRFSRMFDMSNDSHLFHDQESLEHLTAVLGSDGRFRLSVAEHVGSDNRMAKEWLPLLEGKMIHIYDHRFGTYLGQTPEQARQGKLPELSDEDHANPNMVGLPRYWISSEEVANRVRSASSWLTLVRRFGNIKNERTGVACFSSLAGAGDSLLLLNCQQSIELQACLLANINTHVLDFIIRLKMGSNNLNMYVLKQLPVLPPETYTPELLESIVPRVLELTYTAHDMEPFARDLGYEGPPFVWDEERRAQLRADLDGIYAHLYGISRDDFAYILDTFPIVARNDIKAFGEYRTKRLCLEAYDRFAPETLRALELRVRAIERALRQRINDAANGDVEVLASSRRDKLRSDYEYQHKDVTGTPSFRDLLSSTTMEDLEKLIRDEAIWPAFQPWGLSKRKFEDVLSDLAAFRNPMAHGREVSEPVRLKGEAAVAWFEQRLGLESTHA